MTPRKVIIWIIVILCLIVLFQNTQTVSLQFLFWSVSVSQIFLIPIVLVIGFILGYLMARVKGNRGESL
jgi:uncharacterized integral membrane protein